jgi:CRISPR-associated protein Csb1
MFKSLMGSPRLLLDVPLRPVQGDRFQPTGFADLGAAVYQRPDGTQMLLVESAQSVANRLEKACLDGDGPRIASEFAGLPYVLVKLTGASDTETSSLVEAHRINSPFIISDVAFQTDFLKASGYAKGKPLDWKKIAAAVFRFDPNSLLHGVFMANLEDGRVKIPRAVTGFIEAEGVREAASGGVKNNAFDPSGTIRVAGFDKDVYGNVPYHRIEFTAANIRAYFNIDLALLEGFGLPQAAYELLVGLALYKIRMFLDKGLRLRTACDFDVMGAPVVNKPAGFELPSVAELLSLVQDRIKKCTKEGLFNNPPVSEIKAKVVKKTKGTEAAAEEAAEDSE